MGISMCKHSLNADALIWWCFYVLFGWPVLISVLQIMKLRAKH